METFNQFLGGDFASRLQERFLPTFERRINDVKSAIANFQDLEKQESFAQPVSQEHFNKSPLIPKELAATALKRGTEGILFDEDESQLSNEAYTTALESVFAETDLVPDPIQSAQLAVQQALRANYPEVAEPEVQVEEDGFEPDHFEYETLNSDPMDEPIERLVVVPEKQPVIKPNPTFTPYVNKTEPTKPPVDPHTLQLPGVEDSYV